MKLVASVALCLTALGTMPALFAQVLTPMELADPKAQRLQQRYSKALTAIGSEIVAHKFPYPFYFSRVLDIDQAKMPTADQRSIRFDIYKSQTVLEITGNYYAAYSADRMDSYARVKETFQQVIMPILKASVPHFPDDSVFSAYAIEVSHHVQQKVMGVRSERPENVTVLIPVLSAQNLVDAKTDDQRQAAVLEAQMFLNGQPYSLWIGDGTPSEAWIEDGAARTVERKAALEAATVSARSLALNSPSVSADLMKTTPSTMRIVTQEELSKLQRRNDDAISRMTEGLDQQAHFVSYAPPNFIGFRQGTYLQLSLTTQLNIAAGTSRYKLAALAFDEHISHLVRPTLNYFPGEQDFDGITFSSVVHTADGSTSLAVEFFFPFRTMRCFSSYDCTGQQLIDSGAVVINGERSALDLQVAEGKN